MGHVLVYSLLHHIMSLSIVCLLGAVVTSGPVVTSTSTSYEVVLV